MQTWIAALTGAWDDDIIDLLTRMIHPGSVVLDVGASLGLWTVPMASVCAKIGARVVAVEPSERNCFFLKRNVAINNLEGHVDLQMLALGDATGRMTMEFERGGLGNGWITNGLSAEDRRTNAMHFGSDGEYEVTLARLDDFQLPAGYTSCSLIKMDVEGFEPRVLRGGMHFLRRHRPVIFGEFSPYWMRSRYEDTQWVDEWAEAMDYEMFTVQCSRSSPWRPRSPQLVPSSGCEGETLLIPRGSGLRP